MQSDFPHYYPQSTLINLMLQAPCLCPPHSQAIIELKGGAAPLDLGEINIGAAAAASEGVPGGGSVFGATNESWGRGEEEESEIETQPKSRVVRRPDPEE